MLNITAQQNAAGAKSYFAQADYYSQGQEVTGRWYGAAAAMLGLSGTVEQADFHRLCDNLHPQTGEPLTAKTIENRRVGYDFTWSAPKSVSIVQALTGDEAILTAWQDSIHQTMSEMEQEMATRVRKGGQDTDRVTGRWVYAEFLHHTSRPVDGVPAPQLHTSSARNKTRPNKSSWPRLRRDSPASNCGNGSRVRPPPRKLRPRRQRFLYRRVVRSSCKATVSHWAAQLIRCSNWCAISSEPWQTT